MDTTSSDLIASSTRTTAALYFIRELASALD